MHAERDYLERTIATVRNHDPSENSWVAWAGLFADEIERLWGLEEQLEASPTEREMRCIARVLDPDRYPLPGEDFTEIINEALAALRRVMPLPNGSGPTRTCIADPIPQGCLGVAFEGSGFCAYCYELAYGEAPNPASEPSTHEMNRQFIIALDEIADMHPVDSGLRAGAVARDVLSACAPASERCPASGIDPLGSGRFGRCKLAADHDGEHVPEYESAKERP